MNHTHHPVFVLRLSRSIVALVVCGLFALALAATPAHASYEWLGAVNGEFGASGEGVLGPGASGIAVDDASGDVYVANKYTARVTKFDPEGKFLGALGWNVTATGPDKAGVDQVEELTVRASAGKFKLEFSNRKTGELNFDVSAHEMEEALDGLASVGGAGGAIKVSGGAGDATGSKPYILTFEGALGDEPPPGKAIIFVSYEDAGLSGGSPTSAVEDKVLTGGSSAFEDCAPVNGDSCRQQNESTGEGVGQFKFPSGVAVDNSCSLHVPVLTEVTTPSCKEFDPFDGDVYILDGERQKGVVQVFNSDGKFVTSFGENVGPGPVGPTPEKIHFLEPGIAVGPLGEVYIDDSAPALAGNSIAGVAESRVMVFKPNGLGYEYAGRSHDIAVGYGPRDVAVDAAGNVYVTDENGINSGHVFMFAAGEPTTPACESEKEYASASLAVDPLTGQSFVHIEHPEGFHQLGSCDTQTKKLVETASFPSIAKEEEAIALAFNPFQRFENNSPRPRGLMYAIAGESASLRGLIFSQAPVSPPKVASESTSDVGGSYATLVAGVEPFGYDTHYRFQYSTEDTEACAATESCIEAPVGGGELQGSQDDVAAGVTLTGLKPETAYHFRVLVSSHCSPEVPAEECTGTGPDHVFMTFSAATTGLPDGRVYEMVSPPFKDGSNVFPVTQFAVKCGECVPGVFAERFPMQSAPDGDSFVYEGAAFAATGEARKENEYLARRTATGWETHDLSPVLEQSGAEQGFQAFSRDLSAGVLYEQFPEPGLVPETVQAPSGYSNIYLRDTGLSGGLQPLLTATSLSAPIKRAPGSLALKFDSASPDLAHVVFSANDALTAATGSAPAAVDNGTNLYEWSGGALRLVNVLPGNGSTGSDAVLGSGRQLALKTVNVIAGPNFSNAVSADGSRIFWSAGGRVYVRESGESTVEIGDPNGAFLAASTDGHRVLLSDGYLYEEEANGEYAAAATLTEGQGGFQGILGTSDDLSKVYFADTAVLTGEEENSRGAKAQEGGENLYLWDEGTVTFIATTSFTDSATFVVGDYDKASDFAAAPGERTAQTTPDGRYLAFMSVANITGYDNREVGTDCKHSGNLCFEVFEYDSVLKRLVCASCDPTGERPIGPSMLNVMEPDKIPLPKPSSLSVNGRVFFDSTDALSPKVTNAGMENVYEYEPEGVGSCARAGGCLSLISSGVGESESDFVNATPSGSDVFFTTRSKLAPADQDQLFDLYDARENGGFAPASVPPPCTNTDSCRVAPGAQPTIFGAPPSQTFTGAGNPSPAPPGPSVAPKSLTRAQQLAKALKICKRLRVKRKRVVCENQARKRYGAKAKAKRSSRRVRAAGVKGRK